MSFDGSENSRFAVSPRLLLGAAIALLGVLLTLDRFNLAVAAELLRFWPAAIIAVGLAIFVQSRKVGGGINGVIVMGVGGWLLLNSLGIVQVRFWQLFWPMVLMAIGSILVVQTLRHRGPAGAQRRRHADRLRRPERRQTHQRRRPLSRRRAHPLHGRRPHRSAPGDDSAR